MNDLFPYAAPVILSVWFFVIFQLYRINRKVKEPIIMDRLAVYKVDYHEREVQINRILIKLHHAAEAAAFLRAPLPKDVIEELKSAFKALLATHKELHDMCVWYYPTFSRNGRTLREIDELTSDFKSIKAKYERVVGLRKVIDEYIRHNPSRPQRS